MWDLATRDNWELILSDSRSVTYTRNTSPNNVSYYYEPISPIYANPNSHILLIGTKSATAKPHWFLGARASQLLYVSPSFITGFISGVQASSVKPVGLNRLTIIKFDNYDTSPYTLQLDIPHWLEDVYVEVWEYNGYIEQGYEDILIRLDSIEDTLNALDSYNK